MNLTLISRCNRKNLQTHITDILPVVTTPIVVTLISAAKKGGDSMVPSGEYRADAKALKQVRKGVPSGEYHYTPGAGGKFQRCRCRRPGKIRRRRQERKRLPPDDTFRNNMLIRQTCKEVNDNDSKMSGCFLQKYGKGREAVLYLFHRKNRANVGIIYPAVSITVYLTTQQPDL